MKTTRFIICDISLETSWPNKLGTSDEDMDAYGFDQNFGETKVIKSWDLEAGF
jgi:hypothetical protein